MKQDITETLENEKKYGYDGDDDKGVDIEVGFHPRDCIQKEMLRVVEGLNILEND